MKHFIYYKRLFAKAKIIDKVEYLHLCKDRARRRMLALLKHSEKRNHLFIEKI